MTPGSRTLISAKILASVGMVFFMPATHAESIEVNGVELEYEIQGSGPSVVLFEAGALSGMAGWDAIWDRLPQSVTAIRYSRRGEGKSEPCRGDLSATDYIKDTEQLLRSLGIERPFVYVSHSYGGKIAREFAARNPAKLAAMLFIDPSNPRDLDIVLELDPVNGPAENERVKQGDFEAGHGKWCFLKDLWEKHPAPGVEKIGDLPITLIAGVRRVENPTLIFHRDEARERWGQIQAEWVSQFPRGRAVMATDSGHFVQDDQPELVLKELVRLLERADGG